ncbi:spore coat protein GerQ [Paenibacillus beijingensis]|uniref:Spore coat protein n=1 Tax=Paenibacillus beijingensis TaxID=1126833 RepID=A0A0D5NL66_9BACL|nr:spore coat protein GerQ [Paenibacillus beijingensis]AJY75737.1 spore coat protein [Paenibacillus beijingensis]
MSYGYGYPTSVSPASTGFDAGFGYGGNFRPNIGPSMQVPYPVSPLANQMPYPTSVQGAATGMPPAVPSGAIVTPSGGTINTLPAVEESYVENILRLNRGKMATFYMTYENNREWNAKIFRGIIEAAGRDHIIISDPTTGMRFLLLTLNLDYVTFEGPIAYQYPFQGSVVSNLTPVSTSATPASTPASTATATIGTAGR